MSKLSKEDNINKKKTHFHFLSTALLLSSLPIINVSASSNAKASLLEGATAQASTDYEIVDVKDGNRFIHAWDRLYVRELYLKNVYHSLKDNSPMLFFRESYRRNETYQGVVNTVDEWAKITGEDYQTSQPRQIRNGETGNIEEVFIPLLPARAKNKEQYIEEFERAGFVVDHFVEMGASTAIPHSATIYVRKGK